MLEIEFTRKNIIKINRVEKSQEKQIITIFNNIFQFQTKRNTTVIY